MKITQLGYLRFEVSDLNSWSDLCTKILGMETRPRDANGPLYLRMDDRHHRIALIAAEKNRIAGFGWEVPDANALSQMGEDLQKSGLTVNEGSSAERNDRKVLGLLLFDDPGGFPCEIYHGPRVDHVPFTPGRAITGFKTGSLGLGHIVLATEEPRKLVAFYQQYLGFRVSDYIDFADAEITFLHCNPRQHTLAVLNPALGSQNGTLNHFMVEVNSLDDVGRAYDLCMEKQVPLQLSLGRHTNDHMTSFYLTSPSGFSIEYGFGGLEIDVDNWRVQHFVAPSLWGHNGIDEKGVVSRLEI